VVLLKSRVGISCGKLGLHHAAEVDLAKDSVVGYIMVHLHGLKIVQVLEVASVAVAK
jgi:hypothetical protein